MPHYGLNLLAGITLGFASALANAGSVTLPGIGQDFHVNVASFKEVRFKTVYKQQYDFSCGSASLASLLTFHYDFPVKEKEVFDSMYTHGDTDKIRREGFSLLDMQQYLKRQGFDSAGYRLSLEQFQEKVALPAIVLVNTSGYKHFVIVKGIKNNRVMLGDPARGVRTVRRDEFEQNWNGIFFVIRNRLKDGRDTYSHSEEWQAQAEAPYSMALTDQNLGQLTMTTTWPGRF